MQILAQEQQIAFVNVNLDTLEQQASRMLMEPLQMEIVNDVMHVIVLYLKSEILVGQLLMLRVNVRVVRHSPPQMCTVNLVPIVIHVH